MAGISRISRRIAALLFIGLGIFSFSKLARAVMIEGYTAAGHIKTVLVNENGSLYVQSTLSPQCGTLLNVRINFTSSTAVQITTSAVADFRFQTFIRNESAVTDISVSTFSAGFTSNCTAYGNPSGPCYFNMPANSFFSPDSPASYEGPLYIMGVSSGGVVDVISCYY